MPPPQPITDFNSVQVQKEIDIRFVRSGGSDATLRKLLKTRKEACKWLVDPRNTILSAHDKTRLVRQILQVDSARARRLAAQTNRNLWEDIKQGVRRYLASVEHYGTDLGATLDARELRKVVRGIKTMSKMPMQQGIAIRSICFRPLLELGIFENLALNMVITWLIAHVGPPMFAKDTAATQALIGGRTVQPATFAADPAGTIARLHLRGSYEGLPQ